MALSPAPTLVRFAKALWGSWSSNVSGSFSVVFGLLALVPSSLLALIGTSAGWITSYIGALGLSAFGRSSYLLWFSERNKVRNLEVVLEPKLELRFNPHDRACFTETTAYINGAAGMPERVFYVRVLPVCHSTPVDGCVGAITGVYVRRSDADPWERTEFDERLDLCWSNRDSAEAISLHADVPQFLDVLMVRKIPRTLSLCTPGFAIPNRAANVFDSARTFRIDVVVLGANSARADISITIQAGRNGGPPPTVAKLD